LNLTEDWSDTDPYVGSATIRINDESGNNINGLKAGTEHLLTFSRMPHMNYAELVRMITGRVMPLGYAWFSSVIHDFYDVIDSTA